MVTKLQGGRGQIAIKGREIDDEWEALIKKAAARTNSTVAGFIVDHTRSAAQAILKDQPAIPVALPVRIEDVAAGLQEQLATFVERQDTRLAALAADHAASAADLRQELARNARRGRWRR